MTMSLVYLLLSLLFILSQGLFSGLETGLVSVLRPRAEHAAAKGSWRARMLVYFLRRPGIMIATALISVNISVVLASLMATEFFRTLNWTGNTALTLGSMVLSVLLLCFEIFPKNWFRENACERCICFIPVFSACYRLLWLPVPLFSALPFRAFAVDVVLVAETRRRETVTTLSRYSEKAALALMPASSRALR